MNKIVKKCIVGGVIYVMCDISFRFGKGYMLGTMAKLDVTGSQGLNALDYLTFKELASYLDNPEYILIKLEKE